MRRADRLLMILQYLSGGRLTTARQLADRLEVSLRTIYRDVADLISTGVPIDGEAGVGYVLREGYHLPPLMFTEEEIVALVAGARLVSAWGGHQMAQAATEALTKIEMVLPARARARARQVPVHAPVDFGVSRETSILIDRIEHAAHTHYRLRIRYADGQGQDSERVIRPLGLWFWGKVWTVVGWCEWRADFRTFRVDRIRDCVVLDQFRPEPGQSLRDFWNSRAAHDRPPDHRQSPV